MKKMFFSQMVICAFAVFTAACSRDVLTDEQVDYKQITMTASDFVYDASSRTLIDVSKKGGAFAWAEEDTVGVFPDEGRQVDFPMIKGAGTKKAYFDGGGWALKPSSRYMAYYPMRGEFYLDKKMIPVDYQGQLQNGNASTAHLGRFDFMAAVASTPSQGNVNFDFQHLGSLVQLNFISPVQGEVNEVSLTADQALFAITGTVDLTAECPSICQVKGSKKMKVGVEGLTVAKGEAVQVYLMMAPVDLSGHSVRVKVIVDGTDYEAILTASALEAGKLYRFDVTLDKQEPLTTYHVARAGTLPLLVGEENKYKLTELKLTGEINGTDIRFIREMAGSDVWGNPTTGKLAVLDLYGANIVEGGERYYTYKDDFRLINYYTYLNEVGRYMFYKCASLTRVVLPKEVTSIGWYAFEGCKDLEKIFLPETVTSIGTQAFYQCSALTEVNIPKGITSIEERTFYQCAALTAIHIPEGVSTIGLFAFGGCKSLNSVSLAEGITTIEDGAFDGCIGLTSVAVPESVESLSGFSKCTGLTHVSIGQKVTTIGYNAFSGCTGLTEIVLPEGLLAIENGAFTGCTGLSSVNIPKTVKHLSGFAGCNFSHITIPEGVTSIGDYAFSRCKKLTEIKFPDGITVIGDRAFYGCSGLTSIDLPKELTSIGGYAFSECEALHDVSIPGGVTFKGDLAFSGNKNLTEVNLAEGIVDLGYTTFAGCTGLKSITLPSTVTSIQHSLSDCRNMESIYCLPLDPPVAYIDYVFSASCRIYVPASAVEKYRSADGWSFYAEQIVALPEHL